MNFGCSHGQRVSPAPGAEPVLKLLGPSAEDRPAEKWVCVCSLENVALIVRVLLPGTWKWGWDQPKEKPKRVPDSTAFHQDSFFPRTWDFGFSAKGVVPVYEAAASATRQEANLSRGVGPLCKTAASP